jgi:hypothetical protein
LCQLWSKLVWWFWRRFVCLFVLSFELDDQFYSYLVAITIASDRAANLNPLNYSFQQWGFFLRATPTATWNFRFKVISERPVILTSECRALGEEIITAYFNVLGLRQPARTGLELTKFRMLSESTITRLQQPMKKLSICKSNRQMD